MTLGEQRSYTKALQDYNTRHAQSQEEIAKQGAMTKRQLDIDEARHKRLLDDIDTGKKSGRRFKIGVVNGQERLLPDSGTFAGNVYGGDVSDQDIPDAWKDKILRARRFDDGSFEYVPTTQAKVQISVDPSSPTGHSRIVYDAAGNFISKSAVSPESAAPKTTTSTRESVQEITDANGNVIKAKIPLNATTIRQTVAPTTATPTTAVPGIPIPRGTAPSTKPQGTASAVPPGVKSLGTAPSQTRREQEQQLTAPALKDLRDTDAVLDLVHKVQAELSKNKNDNTPAKYFLPSLAYKLGYANEADLLSKLNIGQIVEAGRLIHPTGTRAVSVLDKAMIHTPQTWSDSPKLMYDKLKNIEDNLQDYRKETLKYGQKYPGLPMNRNSQTPNSNVPRKPLGEIFKK
jgi:hypothetical protein